MVIDDYRLVGGDWNHGLLWLSIYWEFHHPNWLTPSFFRGIETTNQMIMMMNRKHTFLQIGYIFDLGIMISMMNHFVYFVHCVQPWWKNGVEQDGVDLWRLGGWCFFGWKRFHGKRWTTCDDTDVLACPWSAENSARARNLLNTYGGFLSRGGSS